MVTVTPDPKRNSNGDDYGNQYCYNYPWPFERGLGDVKTRSAVLSRHFLILGLRK